MAEYEFSEGMMGRNETEPCTKRPGELSRQRGNRLAEIRFVNRNITDVSYETPSRSFHTYS